MSQPTPPSPDELFKKLAALGFKIVIDPATNTVNLGQKQDAPKDDVVTMGTPPPFRQPPPPKYTIGPDYVPSPEEVALLSKRMEKSKASREAYMSHCEGLKKNPVKLPSLESQFASYITRKREAETYRPKGIRAKFLFFVESCLKKVASWFTYRERAKVAEKPKTQADILRESLVGAFTSPDASNDPTTEFFGAINSIIEDTTETNLVRLPGESKKQAIDRIVATHMLKYQQKQAVKNQEDELLGLEDGELAHDRTELAAEMKAKVRTGPMRIKKGNGTDPLEIVGPEGRIADRPTWLNRSTIVAKLNEERVAVDYVGVPEGAIKERPAPVDPILTKIKEKRLDELLSKDVLNESEKRELEDLTQGSVNIL
jgi:hypothetical protein